MALPCTVPEADPNDNRLATSPAVCIPDFRGVFGRWGLGDGPKIFLLGFSGDVDRVLVLDADEAVGRAKEGVEPDGRVRGWVWTRGDLGVVDVV